MRRWMRRSMPRSPMLLAAVCCAAALPAGAAVPSFEAVRAAHAPSDVPLLDRHGAVLQLVRVDASVRRGPWVPLSDISPALRTAIVLGEDRRFHEHGGVDWRALAASAWANAFNEKTRGASTLTMQLAGLSDAELARPAGGRSVVQKLSQMHRAQQFEARWSKSQILEAYLNRVPLRGELVGVAAASQQLFGKHASGLDATEAALMASMVRAPNAASRAVERRACDVLKLQRLDCGGVAITLAQALTRKPGAQASRTGEVLAPHLATRLSSAEPTGGALRTTLDARLQRVAIASLRRHLAELRGRNVEDGAVLVLDNASGEVLAWVGSSGDLSQAAAVDAVTARRQPGSTLKPLVYASALQQRLITAASQLDDAPLQLAAGIGVYAPQNYDRGFKGMISARTALASSLNVPAVRVGSMLGPDSLWATLNDAGLQISESGSYHGHALALGSAEVTLLDLANAYRMLANGGLWSPARWTPTQTPAGQPHRVFDTAVTFIVADILADPAARALTFGLDSPLVTRRRAAVKTGTSKDLRDNWCVGFTRSHTVAVWVGNASGAPMHDTSGVSGAAPVWREVVSALTGNVEATPHPPAGLVRQDGEWFLRGTEPGSMPGDLAKRFGIASPTHGSVIVLDPEIPMAAQRMVFEGEPGRWRLDGQPVGQGTKVAWMPRPGRHVLEHEALHPDTGGSVEAISFEVRARLPTKPPARRR